MTLTPIKTPLVAKKMFPNYVWDIATNGKTLYLTFDDGPTPEITNWTLETLKTYGAKATFFCVGKNIETHPEIFKNILNDGHAIGNHTQNHIKGWKTKCKDYLENIKLCEDIFENYAQNSILDTSKIVNQKSLIKDRKSLIVNLFRPPYGQITPKQGKALMALGYKIVMWDVISFDWDVAVTPKTCLNNVISKATSGSIVVFHDSVKASKNMQFVLPKVLDFFSNSGYAFKALNF